MFRITSHEKCCSLVGSLEPTVPSSVADPDPHHIGKLDPDPDPHQSGKLNPNPHQSDKRDPDPHRSEKQDPYPRQSEKEEALEVQFGAMEDPSLEKSEW
jgi:hypothetical protein